MTRIGTSAPQEANGEVHHLAVVVEDPERLAVVDAVLSDGSQERHTDGVAGAITPRSIPAKFLAELGCGYREEDVFSPVCVQASVFADVGAPV